jgi:hypothetical protein
MVGIAPGTLDPKVSAPASRVGVGPKTACKRTNLVSATRNVGDDQFSAFGATRDVCNQFEIVKPQGKFIILTMSVRNIRVLSRPINGSFRHARLHSSPRFSSRASSAARSAALAPV